MNLKQVGTHGFIIGVLIGFAESTIYNCWLAPYPQTPLEWVLEIGSVVISWSSVVLLVIHHMRKRKKSSI